MSVGPLISVSATTGDTQIITSFRICSYVMHVSSWIVAKLTESSLILWQEIFGPCWGKHYQKIYNPYLWIFLWKFCFSRLLSSYSLLFLLVLLNFWLGYYCSMWLFQSGELVKFNCKHSFSLAQYNVGGEKYYVVSICNDGYSPCFQRGFPTSYCCLMFRKYLIMMAVIWYISI